MLFRLFVFFFQTITYATADNSSSGLVGGPRQKVYVQVVQTTNIIYILSCQNIDPLSEAFAPGMRVTEMNYCPCAVWLERPWREVTEIFRLASQIKRSLPEKKKDI